MSEMPPVPEPELPRQPAPTRSIARSLVADVIKFAIFFLILYLYVMQVSVVRGSSMQPSFHDGDRLVVDKISYLVSDIHRFDVIVLRAPTESAKGMDFIKRVIALPGETVEIRDGRVIVNNKEISGDFQPERSHDDWPPHLVRQGEYFVLGDNRPYSNDSRAFGMVKREAIRGKIRVRFWPLTDFKLFG
jgi:signal peptidase I